MAVNFDTMAVVAVSPIRKMETRLATHARASPMLFAYSSSLSLRRAIKPTRSAAVSAACSLEVMATRLDVPPEVMAVFIASPVAYTRSEWMNLRPSAAADAASSWLRIAISAAAPCVASAVLLPMDLAWTRSE